VSATRRLGRWALLDFLGEGGTGRVYAASDGERDGAIKVVRPIRPLHPHQVEEAWERLRARLSALARVDDPGVISVWDWGYERADAELWFAMERLRGRALRVADPPELADLVVVARALARGLAAVHAHDLVHGDLKPPNLFREPGGRAVIVDFALPVLHEQVGAPAGSPRWMAPECLRGEPTTPAADVYALCQSLGELAIGRALVPVSGRGPARLLDLMEHKIGLRSLDPGPQAGALRELVMQGTARLPQDRPTATELASRLKELG